MFNVYIHDIHVYIYYIVYTYLRVMDIKSFLRTWDIILVY